MFMQDPKKTCSQHLLGEHFELHKHMHCWRKHQSITGRIKSNCIEPMSYKTRHDALADEMTRRGMSHKSQIEQPDFSYLPEHEANAKVDVQESKILLLDRCSECRKMHE
jgi:hypothetical protein